MSLPDGIRKFESGATRDSNTGKYEYARFFDPEVLESFAGYMHRHRTQKDGSVRDPDNWKKGIPRQTYMDSLARHVMDLWIMHNSPQQSRTRPDTGEIVTEVDAIHGILFNAMGYLYERMNGR